MSKSFGGRTLFSDVTFTPGGVRPAGARRPQRRRQDHACSTSSAASEDADEGRILFAKGARVGYLEQEAIEMGDRPVFEEVMSSQVEVLEAEQRLRELEAVAGRRPHRAASSPPRAARATPTSTLGGYTIEAKVRGVLFGLGFKAERPLAGHARTSPAAGRCASRLAKLLVRNPEVLHARRAHQPPGPRVA